MIGKQQLDIDLTHITQFGSFGLDDHTGPGCGGTSCGHTLADDFNQTETAGSVDGKFRVIAEGRQVNTCFADNFKQIAFAFDRNFYIIDY